MFWYIYICNCYLFHGSFYPYVVTFVSSDEFLPKICFIEYELPLPLLSFGFHLFRLLFFILLLSVCVCLCQWGEFLAYSRLLGFVCNLISQICLLIGELKLFTIMLIIERYVLVLVIFPLSLAVSDNLHHFSLPYPYSRFDGLLYHVWFFPNSYLSTLLCGRFLQVCSVMCFMNSFSLCFIFPLILKNNFTGS